MTPPRPATSMRLVPGPATSRCRDCADTGMIVFVDDRRGPEYDVEVRCSCPAAR